jgi:tRNA dimethylallyltransferase
VGPEQLSAGPTAKKYKPFGAAPTPPFRIAITTTLMHVVAIFGPTGVGKTGVAIALAELLRERGENPIAISCDALQVYEGLNVLTGVASEEQQAKLEHRLVGFVPVTQPFSVGDYMRLAHSEIDAALAAGRRPIVVGGTGLYLRAAVAELSLEKAPSGSEDSELWSPETRLPTTIFGLDMERSLLYERIDARTETIVAGGAEEEVRRAEAAGPSRTARKALGFDELLSGDIEAMKKRSRNYARRQLTWMRKIPTLSRIDRTDRSDADVATEIVASLGRAVT